MSSPYMEKSRIESLYIALIIVGMLLIIWYLLCDSDENEYIVIPMYFITYAAQNTYGASQEHTQNTPVQPQNQTADDMAFNIDDESSLYEYMENPMKNRYDNRAQPGQYAVKQRKRITKGDKMSDKPQQESHTPKISENNLIGKYSPY